MGFHAVFLQAWIIAQLVVGVAHHLVQGDGQRLTLGIRHGPVVAVVDETVRSVHPVQRFVGSAVGVDGHTAVVLHHDQPHGLGEVGGEPTGVVDGAASDHEAHDTSR